SLLLLAEPNRFAAAFALRRLLFSAAERRDYEGVFIACQVSVVFVCAFALQLLHCLAPQPLQASPALSRWLFLFLATIEMSG
ncbi:hypothetical protein, partial [Achromobacter marplatensis]|uniref:hypothetical protein n=3 Tax=Achromobacter marplatensis TaxID=470868 RepID=UPI001ABF55A8